ncbi:hypothetical protein KY284_000797 [Solanum tuberosum]|nr:hypothetical protein KY284_000797 [Solanum tuberosum]
MMKCGVATTPMNINEKLQRADGTEKASPKLFRSLVGGLNYRMHARPDISFSVSVVSRFLQSPTKQHFGAVKRVLRYVAGTTDFGIWYSKAPNLRLVGFTDSDYIGCLDDRKNTFRNYFGFGSRVVTWSSKKQEIVALSTSETEYTTTSLAVQQALWLRKLLEDFNYERKEFTEIIFDSKSTIAMAKNPSFHGRTKHIDVQYHFIWTLVADGRIVLKFCGTNEQATNIFTKSLPQAKHEYFRLQLGVCDFELGGNVS